MAYEADRVVVDLIANTDGFDSKVKSSATTFDQSMNKIQSSVGAAEKATGRLTLAANNNRVAMLEFQHIARGASDQIAAGAPLTQVLAQHMGMLSQAVSLAGGSFGRFGAFLGGPWGIALTLATVVLAKLTLGHKDSGDSVESLVEKLKEHAEKTRNSEEADRLWTQTLDGLIERQHKLNEELGKRLTVQTAVDKADLVQAQKDAADLQDALQKEKDKLASLKKQLAGAQQPGQVTAGFQGPFQSSVTAGVLGKQIAESETQIQHLEKAVTDAQGRIVKGQILIGEATGKAIADMSAKASAWSEGQLAFLRFVETLQNGKLAPNTAQLSESFETLKHAIDDAASAGVGFDDVTKRTDALNDRLRAGKITVRTYTTEVLKLAKALQEQADAAKEAAKQNPRDQFKRSVIGAEGTGPNKMGSPAAGFGQFMPDTWLSYFNRLFPDKAQLSDAAKLGFRNVRAVADAVIDKATDDYVAVLKAAGQQITAANLYAAHVLGGPDSKKYFAAVNAGRTGETVVQALGGTRHAQAVADQNPKLLSGTIAQAQAAFAKRIGDSSGAVSQGAVALAQLLQQEKERERQFLNAKADLDGSILDARQDMGLSVDETAKIEHMAVEASRAKYEQNVKALEAEGKYSADEAAILIDLNNQRAGLRDELVKRRADERKFRESEARNQNAETVQSGLFDTQSQLLQSEEQLAKTAAQRRDIEQQLLNIQFEEERMRLQAQINLADRLKAEAQRTKSAQDIAAAEAAEAQAAIARSKLATLPQRQANATAANNQANAGPLKSYLDSIPQTAAQIDDALEQVAANGLANFADGVADAVANFHSLGDVARSVLQQLTQMLIRMVVQQLILKAFQFIGLSGGGMVGGGTTFAKGGMIRGFAPGGHITGPGGPTSDSVPIMASAGEFMIRTNSARKLGYRTLEYINQFGELPPHFAGGGQIRGIQPMNVAAAGAGGRGGFSQDDIRFLRGIVGEAARAVPDVSLYASLDPADMLQRALGAPAGHRALLAHVGANSGAFKGALK